MSSFSLENFQQKTKIFRDSAHQTRTNRNQRKAIVKLNLFRMTMKFLFQRSVTSWIYPNNVTCNHIINLNLTIYNTMNYDFILND